MDNMTHNTELLIATERERWLRLHLESNLSIVALSQRSGFSRDTLHRWKKAYLASGVDGLKEKSRAHHSHPKTTPASIVERIRKIRQEHDFCAAKIRIRLSKQGIAMSTRGIHKVLTRELLVRNKKRMKRENIWRPKSLIPGELVEIDVALMRKFKGKWLYQFTAIDCCTRWRFLRTYSEQHIFNAVQFLLEVIEYAPFRILGVKTDNGSIFTSRYTGAYKRKHQNRTHLFYKTCQENGIIHYLIDPGKPAQNGKVERSHRTDREEFWGKTTFASLSELEAKQKAYVDWYNQRREHLGINGLTPMQKLKECQI